MTQFWHGRWLSARTAYKMYAEVVHRFGPFSYDSSQHQLSRDSEVVPLAPKAADTLQALLDNRGRVVGKPELMKLVWPDCSVEEIGLARNISLLRKTLGDESEQYIQTVPKRGYRFVAEETDAAVPMPPAKTRGMRVPAAIGALVLVLAGAVYWQFYRPSRFVPRYGTVASVAIVPIEVRTPELERSGFATAFNEALVEELAKSQVAEIVSPSTVQRYRRWHVPVAMMTRLLGNDVVVEGSAQSAESRVRISLRLSDVHSGKLIWAGGYEIAPGELNDGEMRVARSVAAEIGRKLGPH